MKTRIGILTLSLLMVCLFTTAKGSGTSLLSGQSLTELGQYSIDVADHPISIGAETLKTYELKYENCESPVLIGVKKTKKCMNFIVRTENFEIEYVCNNHVFGVNRINKDYQTVESRQISQMLNNTEYFHQQVISQNPKTEMELLGLIACYFPTLVKNDHLAEL
jgi:hypothetical protein